jgi:hypothetical protein
MPTTSRARTICGGNQKLFSAATSGEFALP